MTALVTGATGFVGSAVLRALLRRSQPVRALVRPTSSRRLLEGLPVEIVAGDLADPASCRGALRGCDTLFHVAADYRLWVPQPDAMYRTNVVAREGSSWRRPSRREPDRVHQQRRHSGSSGRSSALRRDHAGNARRHDRSLQALEIPGREGGARAHRRSRASGRHRQSFGPRRPRRCPADPTGRVLLEAARGRIPAYVDTGLNLVHVDDVAEGISGRWLAGAWASATFSAERTCRSARCSPYRTSGRPQTAAAARPVRRTAAACLHCRSHGPHRDRRRAFGHRGWHPNGPKAHVFHIGQGRTRTRLSEPPGCGRVARCHRLVPRLRLSTVDHVGRRYSRDCLAIRTRPDRAVGSRCDGPPSLRADAQVRDPQPPASCCPAATKLPVHSRNCEFAFRSGGFCLECNA